eukprot:scaffold1940_cov149-Amphora_coffeaeformis.AAC.5
MSKVKSARALFEKRIELNLEQNGDVQSKDFIAVVGRTNPGSRSLLASPRRRTIRKAASVAVLPGAPTLARTTLNKSPPAPAKDVSPLIRKERPKLVTSLSHRESAANDEKWGSSKNKKGPNGFSESTSFSSWADELKAFGNESLVQMLHDDGKDCVANDVHDEDSRLVECLHAFDQSIRMANAKKIKAFNRRGSLVQEVLEELDESLVEATQQAVLNQSQQETRPKITAATAAATDDSVIALKASSIRNNRRFTSSRCSSHSARDNSCQSPGGGTVETCSTTSYETSASFESTLQPKKAGENNKNHRLLWKSYGYNKQRGNSPTSSVTSSVSKSSCGSAKSMTFSSNPKSSPLVAPSPSTMERHSQVRNSVLQSLRPAPLIEQEDEKTTLKSSTTTDRANQMLSQSSSIAVEEAVDSTEEHEGPSPALQFPGAVVSQPKAIGSYDEEFYKNHGGDSSSSSVSHVGGSFRALGHNSLSEVNFGFGPMSPHRVVRPSFDIGLGSCYTVSRALATPDGSQCCPDDILEAQKSMLIVEDEEDEHGVVKEISIETSGPAKMLEPEQQGKSGTVKKFDNPGQLQESATRNPMRPGETDKNGERNISFQRNSAGAEQMDGTCPSKHLGNEGSPVNVISDVSKIDVGEQDNARTGQLHAIDTSVLDVVEAGVDSPDQNVSQDKPSSDHDFIDHGCGETKSSELVEDPTDYGYKTADKSEAPVDYGYGNTTHVSGQREEAEAALPHTRQRRRSLSFDGEESRDKINETALPGHPKLRGRRASLSIGSPSTENGVSSAAIKYGSRRLSMASLGGDGTRLFRSQSRRLSTGNPFISQQLLSKPHMARSRVSPLELTMKKTEIMARSMARRRGTLVHIATGKGAKKTEDLPHKINDLIKFSLEELWKRRRRTPAQQNEIDRKADELFPKREEKLTRRASMDAPFTHVIADDRGTAVRRGSLDSIEKVCWLRADFLEENARLGEKIFRVAATRIQARVRAYLQRSHFRIRLLERRWAKIEYKKIQQIGKIEKKLKSRKRVHKRKVLNAMKELAEQASKARKLTDHLKSENNNIKDQNARLQQLCFKLRKINGHMEKTLKTHNKNFRSMWEFVEKMKIKKKRIEDKVKKYESRIELHQKNIDIVQNRIDSEVKRKEGLVNTIRNIATAITVKSSNKKLKELVDMMSEGKPVDEKLLAEIEEEKEDMDDEEFDLGKSQDFDFLCETFHEAFVSVDVEDEETVDEGFLLALSMDDNSTISDVSSIGSDMDDSADFANDGGDDAVVSVYEEVVVDDEDESVVQPNMTAAQGGEFIEEIIEEVISDDEYIIEEVIVSSDEEDGDDDDFSCQSSVYIDQGSIIM